jgi:hypothetical protein
MSVSNPTPSDRIRWICNTSAEEGRGEIKRLQSNEAISPSDLRAIFATANDYEIAHQNRSSLVSALSAAINKIDKHATATGVRVFIKKLDLPADLAVASAAVEVLAPETVKPLDQGKLISAINANHTAAQADAALAAAAGKSAVCRALVAGLQLIQLREATPHGQWESLFASAEKRLKSPNVNHGCHLEIGFETARRYIAVATALVTKKLEPEQSQALMALATGAEADEAAQHLLDEITPPKSLRQTYLELGIVKPTPKEAAWLSAEPAADPAGEKPSATSKLRSAKDSARIDWFGTHKAGRVEPGSIVDMLATEVSDPARGTMRLLSKADLEQLADLFRNAAKAATERAKEKL